MRSAHGDDWTLLFSLAWVSRGSSIFPRLKSAFLHFAAKGKLSLAELAVTMYPELLFEEGLVTASSGQQMFGTALGLAIMTEDFGREGCNLCLLPADGRLDDSEMLERHIRKCLPIDGEQVIATEWCKRLKDGWEERKAEKLQKELSALKTVRKAIANSRTNADCEKAIQTFINFIAPKGIIEEGFQWNKELLDTAFELGYKENFWDNRKDDLFYDCIIGSIQDTAPDDAAMAQAQGLFLPAGYGREV